MNLFDIPEQLPEQELTEILLTGKTRIERIVSNGRCSDINFLNIINIINGIIDIDFCCV